MSSGLLGKDVMGPEHLLGPFRNADDVPAKDGFSKRGVNSVPNLVVDKNAQHDEHGCRIGRGQAQNHGLFVDFKTANSHG